MSFIKNKIDIDCQDNIQCIDILQFDLHENLKDSMENIIDDNFNKDYEFNEDCEDRKSYTRGKSTKNTENNDSNEGKEQYKHKDARQNKNIRYKFQSQSAFENKEVKEEENNEDKEDRDNDTEESEGAFERVVSDRFASEKFASERVASLDEVSEGHTHSKIIKKRKRKVSVEDSEDDELFEKDEEEIKQDIKEREEIQKKVIEIHTEYGNTLSDLEIESEQFMYLENFRGIPDGFEKNISDELLLEILQINVSWWKSKPPQQSSRVLHATQLWGCCKNGEHPSKKYLENTLDSSDLKFIYQKEMFKRIRLECEFRKRGMLQKNSLKEENNVLTDVASLGVLQCISKLQECISRNIHLLQADLFVARVQDPSVDASCGSSEALSDPFHFVSLKDTKLNDLQSFVLFILRQLHNRGYRRYGDGVYEQYMSPPTLVKETGVYQRFPTRAFKRVCDIVEFILNITKKEDTFAEWQKMMAPGCLENVKKYLMVCKDEEFRELVPDRHWHAFHNGVYNVDTTTFYQWGSKELEAIMKVNCDIVCCKYHEQKFSLEILNAFTWYDIPTPEVHSILEYQFQVDKDAGIITSEDEKIKIISWMYVMLGRMLHDVNAKDKWQVCLFLIGRAGTGKSLLLKAMGWFFNEENVETIANNLQKGFGLESIYNNGKTLACRCMEVKHDFALDQAQLQSMISGEPVSIQRKNQVALSVVWKIPIMLAGNECAKWINNSDSITRRMILAFFERKVPNDKVDPNLDIKIQANIGNLLHKCSMAYSSAVEEFGKNDLWSKKKNPYTSQMEYILPKYFHMNKTRLQEMTHPLVGFLRNDSSILLTEKGMGMPYKRFQVLANAYFSSNGNSKFTWKEDKYKTVFEEYEIKKIKIDNAFIKKYGYDFSVFYLGESFGIGSEWLLGVTERSQVQENDNVNIDQIHELHELHEIHEIDERDDIDNKNIQKNNLDTLLF